MRLEEYGEPLAFEAAFWTMGIYDPEYPIEQLGQLSLDVSDKWRALAIITLLVQADVDRYCHNLIRSARAWRHFLQRCGAEMALDEHHYCSGRYKPFLAALAAGDFDLAKAIARIAPSDFREGHEYLDDFCYSQILFRMLENSPDQQGMISLATRFEAVLDGQPSPRLDICRALISRNQDDFIESFQTLIDLRTREIEEDIEGGQMEEPDIVAERRVFVEGLGILKLGAYIGLVVEDTFPMCPRIALQPMVAPFPDV